MEFFLLILRVLSYLILNIANKHIRFSQTFFENSFEFIPDYKDKLITLYSDLVLLPLIDITIF